MTKEPEFPQRLIDGEGSAAELLRRSLAERVAGPSEARSWQLLRERVSPAPRRFRWMLALAACAVLAGIGASRDWHTGHEPSLGAEPWSAAPPSARSTPAPTVSAVQSTELPAVKRPATSTPKSEARSPEAQQDPARCAALAREGRYEAAADCYDRIAHGRSMAAELALYEKARLESKALGHGEAALATLEEHAQRFPHGVLTSEVGMTRIELLIRLGRADAALAAIEQALTGALGRERPGDLQALKGDLLAARGECTTALEAFAGARAAGVHESRLEAGEKRCARPLEATPGPAESEER